MRTRTYSAGALADAFGVELVGSEVITPAMGAYPGGLAKVIKVHHDPNAPEIVFMVRHPTWKDEVFGPDMGIFEYEEVELIL